MAQIQLQEGDSFVITGRYYNSNRYFKAIYTKSYFHAMNINLWNGSVWLLRDDKRILLKHVIN